MTKDINPPQLNVGYKVLDFINRFMVNYVNKFTTLTHEQQYAATTYRKYIKITVAFHENKSLGQSLLYFFLLHNGQLLTTLST